MAGRLLDYLGQGLAAARPAPAILTPKITIGGLAFYYATDTNQLSILDTTAIAWDSVGGGAGGLVDGDYGDVTISAGGTVISIDSGVVTAAKLGASAIALFESAGAIAAHEGAADPHPGYLTPAEAGTLYAGATHGHTSADISNFNSSADTRVAAGISAHTAAGDPHSQYLLTSEGDALYAVMSHTHTQADVGGLVAALAGKEASITAGTVSQYWRGDKTFATLDKSAVGLGNVDNTSDANKPVSTAQLSALGLKLDATHAGTGGVAHVDVVAAGASGFMTGSDKTKLDGITAGATANSPDSTLLARGNHTGTQTASTITGTKDATFISDFAAAADLRVTAGISAHAVAADPHPNYLTPAEGNASYSLLGHAHADATISVSGFMAAADKVKLNGVAAGATANSPDATLLNRASHTGTQTSATISDLVEVIQDMLGSSGFIVQGANMTITYDDVANQLVFAATGGGGGGGLTYPQLQSAISLGR